MKRVMWFRVSVDGHREFTHHSDPDQVSLSYRGRTRYKYIPPVQAMCIQKAHSNHPWLTKDLCCLDQFINCSKKKTQLLAKNISVHINTRK